jgi:hypothetical protein
MTSKLWHQPPFLWTGLRAFSAALFGLLALSAAAGAAPFILYGQVFQVDPETAEDESIDAAGLPLGPHMPYVRLQVVDPVTGAGLGGPVYAGATGNFTLQFDAPAGSSAAIQVFRVINGEAERIPDARKDINTFPLTSPALGVAVKVASDEVLLLGPGSGLSPDSVGIVFTQVGLVEIPYISQDLTRPDKERIGLADLSGDLTRAAEQNLPASPSAASSNAVFKDAPFGGLLHLFGAFGKLSGTPPCTGEVSWYHVKIRPVTFDAAGNPVYGTALEGSDPLRKMRFEIDYVPTFRADAFLEKIGPYDGEDLTSGSATAIHNLYRVKPFPTSPGQTVVYSMADQRYSWATGSPAGLYEISLEYFRHVGGTATDPDVVKIDEICFDGVLPPEDAAKVALHKLLVRVDNSPLTASMGGLFVKTGGTRSGNFLDPAQKCEIIELSPGSTVEIDFKARHEAGYLRSYSLSATSNAGATVLFASDSYDSHSASGPLWQGAGTAASPVVTATNLSAFNRCAYTFDLVVQGRVQNGYGYLQGAHHQPFYYVMP